MRAFSGTVSFSVHMEREHIIHQHDLNQVLRAYTFFLPACTLNDLWITCAEMARRYFLVYFIFSLCLVAGQSPKYALKGQEFFLKPDIAGQPDGILWKHNGNKVVEFNGIEQLVYTPYENRITLYWVSAELSITELRFEDSGDYELETEVNKELHRSIYKLEVIDKVAKPTISCDMSDGSSSNKSGRLVCSAEPRQPQSLMKFEWRTHGGVQPGPELTISLGKEHDDGVHSCSVSNPLSNETATFTAKDCYPDQSLSVAVIASIIGIVFLIVLIVMVLGICFCKVQHKACFATADLEKQSPPCKTEGSDKMKAQGDENNPLLHRTSTIPSKQPLRNLAPAEQYMDKQDGMPQKGLVKERRKNFEQISDGQTGSMKNIDQHKKTVSPPSFPRGEPPFALDLNNCACSDKDDAESGQLRDHAEDIVTLCDLSDCEKANEPDPGGVSYDLEPKKEADEDKKKQSAPASAETTSATQPHSHLTVSCLNIAPKDATGEHQEDANSDQVTGEISDKNGGESDSSVEEERKDLDDPIEDKQPSTVSEHNGSKTLLHEHDLNLLQDETQKIESNQQEKVKPVSGDEDERNSVGDREDTDEDPDLYLATSTTPTEADNTNDTLQKSSDTAHAGPDQQEQDKISHDLDEGQSDKGKDVTVEDKNEVKCDLKEKKQGNDSRSQDEEGQKKDEAVGL